MTWNEILTESPVLGAHGNVTYRAIPCKTMVGPTRAGGDDPRRALNPYVDCEFACPYCVGHQLNHRRGAGPLGASIGAKTAAPAVVRRELAGREATVVLGTATDPYQPLEERLGLTRRILEEVCAAPGVRLIVATKSDLVTRDRALLARLADEERVRVVLSLATTDGPLARSLEPKAPSPRKRLRALEKLAAAGVPVGLEAAPVLPQLTSSSRELRRLMCAGLEAGASFFRYRLLTLPPAARAPFFAWLAAEHPDLVRRYRRWYRGYGHAPRSVKEQVEVVVAALRRQYHLPAELPFSDEALASDSQLTLFDDVPVEPAPAGPNRSRRLPRAGRPLSSKGRRRRSGPPGRLAC